MDFYQQLKHRSSAPFANFIRDSNTFSHRTVSRGELISPDENSDMLLVLDGLVEQRRHGLSLGLAGPGDLLDDIGFLKASRRYMRQKGKPQSEGWKPVTPYARNWALSETVTVCPVPYDDLCRLANHPARKSQSGVSDDDAELLKQYITWQAIKKLRQASYLANLQAGVYDPIVDRKGLRGNKAMNRVAKELREARDRALRGMASSKDDVLMEPLFPETPIDIDLKGFLLSSKEKETVKQTNQAAQEYRHIQVCGQYLLAQESIREATDRLQITPKHCIDFGCGAGKSALSLRRVFDKSSILGLDISCKMVALSNERKPELGKFEAKRIKRDGIWPVRNESADAVFSLIVIQEIMHESQLRLAFQEMYRVLKKAGWIVLSLVNDKIVDERFTAFSYDSKRMGNRERSESTRVVDGVPECQLRKCYSNVASIVWSADRHWPRETLLEVAKSVGFIDCKIEGTRPVTELFPFPGTIEPWGDEDKPEKAAALMLLTGRKPFG